MIVETMIKNICLHNITVLNFPHIQVHCTAKTKTFKTLFVGEANSAHVVYKLKGWYDICKQGFHSPLLKFTEQIMYILKRFTFQLQNCQAASNKLPTIARGRDGLRGF